MIAGTLAIIESSSVQRCRPGVTGPKPSELSPLSAFCLDQHPRVFVPRELVRLAGDANAGLLLAQIDYWFRERADGRSAGKPRVVVTAGGQHWLPKTRAEFARETGLTERQVKRALVKLQENGFIERLGRSELLRPTHPELSQGNSGVTVFAGLVRMAGNATGGLVLSQIHYWFSDGPDGRTRLTQYRGGHWWLAKQYEDLAEETGITPRQARGAVDRLRGHGLIQTAIYRFSGLNTLHLRYDEAGFRCAWEVQEVSWLEQQTVRR